MYDNLELPVLKQGPNPLPKGSTTNTVIKTEIFIYRNIYLHIICFSNKLNIAHARIVTCMHNALTFMEVNTYKMLSVLTRAIP